MRNAMEDASDGVAGSVSPGSADSPRTPAPVRNLSNEWKNAGVRLNIANELILQSAGRDQLRGWRTVWECVAIQRWIAGRFTGRPSIAICFSFNACNKTSCTSDGALCR